MEKTTNNRIKIYDPGGAFIGSAVDVDNAQRLQELWIEFNQPERAEEFNGKHIFSRRHSGNHGLPFNRWLLRRGKGRVFRYDVLCADPNSQWKVVLGEGRALF